MVSFLEGFFGELLLVGGTRLRLGEVGVLEGE